MRSRMRTIVLLSALSLSALLIFPKTPALADDKAALAAESEEYCNSTAKEAPTPPDAIVAKANQACALLEKEGTAAFSKFKGKGSEFIFDGTYIWIHSLADAEMLMHPIKHKLEGKKLIGLKDPKGKRFFTVMNKVTKDQGSGWVEYYWPKPGSDDIVRKVSYVRKCTTPDAGDVVIGCGIYNTSEDDLAKLEIH